MPQILILAERALDLQRGVDVIEIPRGLQLRLAQLAQRVVRAMVPVADHVPTGGLGTEVDLCADEHGAGYVSRCKRTRDKWILTG